MFEFLQPNFLYLLIPIIILVVFLYFKKSSVKNFSGFEDLEKIYKKNSISYKLYYFIIGSIFIISTVILAQPVLKNTQQKVEKNGIDIMIALDVSLSMKAEDLQPSRIESAKKIIWDFLNTLVSDRVWLVVFSWKPFTSIPLNYDYEVSQKMVDKITTQILDQSVEWLNGTAIWDAIMFAWDSFWTQNQRQKVLILVTDGTANIWVDPLVASQFLQAKFSDYPVKIYTIWLWWDSPAFINYTHPLWFTQKMQVEWVDDETLEKIAEIWNGKYFRATSSQGLEEIFNEISQLEKTPLETQSYQTIEALSKYFIYILSCLFVLFLAIRLTKKI